MFFVVGLTLFLVTICDGSTYEKAVCYCADHNLFANDTTLRNLIIEQAGSFSAKNDGLFVF